MPIYLIDKMSLKQQNINDNMSPYNDFSQGIKQEGILCSRIYYLLDTLLSI